MYHECPIKFHRNLCGCFTHPTRYVHVTEVLDESLKDNCGSFDDHDGPRVPLATYIYTLDFSPLTPEEKRILADIDPNIYCIGAAAIVLCRTHGMLNPTAFRGRKHKSYESSETIFQTMIIGCRNLLISRDSNANYLIAYIHNRMHDGPKVECLLPPLQRYA